MSYGDNVIGAEDRFQSLLGGNIEDYNQTAGLIKEQQQEKQEESLDKWKTTEGLGGDLIGAAVGAPIVAKGITAIKTVKGLISRGKDAVDAVSEQAQGLLSDATESAKNVLTDAAEGLMSRATQSAQRLMTGATDAAADASNSASSYASGVSDTVESAAGTAETSFGGGVPEVAGGLADAGVEAGAEAGADAAGGILADVGLDAVVGAIPVVGEAALIIGGAVTLGDSLYHLFKHKDTTPPVAPPPVASLMAPPQLTSKFADAVPSFDTAVDRSGASSAF